MPPRVLIIAGSPASGKTTLAGYACQALGGATLVDKDTLEWPLANAALVATGHVAHDHGCSFYTDVLKAAAYETMERVAEQAVKAAGAHVVLVAPFTSHSQDPTWLKRLQARLSPTDGPLVDVALVWVTAAPAVLNARKAARGDGRDTVELQAVASAKATGTAAETPSGADLAGIIKTSSGNFAKVSDAHVEAVSKSAAAKGGTVTNCGLSFTTAEAKRQATVPAHTHTWIDTSNIKNGAELQSLAEKLVACSLPVVLPKNTTLEAPAVGAALSSGGDSGSSISTNKTVNGSISDSDSSLITSRESVNSLRRVLCAGHACMDVVLENCDELATRESFAGVEKFGLRPGGAVSNVAMQLAALAGSTASSAEIDRMKVPTTTPLFAVDACTTIGIDGLGTLLLEAWRSAGVGTDRFVNVDSSHATGAACLPVYRRDGKRAVYCAQGWNAHLSPEQLLTQPSSTAVPNSHILAADAVPNVRESEHDLVTALENYHCITLGYPHVMPGLQGEPLRALCRACVTSQCCLALDVNEACDDAGLPLGNGSWDDDDDIVNDDDSGISSGTTTGKISGGGVGVMHANLDEAAGCLGIQAQLWANAAAGPKEGASSLEQVVSLAQVADVAQQLLKRGASIVLITLGANGAYGAVTSNGSKLRQRLGKMCPKDVSGILGACGRVNAFQVQGAVDSVGAGDSFLAGVVAALLWHSKHDEEGTEVDRDLNTSEACKTNAESLRSSSGPSEYKGSNRRALTLIRVLEVGLVSALYKVDTAKAGPAPKLTDLIAIMPALPRLEPPNGSLL